MYFVINICSFASKKNIGLTGENKFCKGKSKNLCSVTVELYPFRASISFSSNIRCESNGIKCRLIDLLIDTSGKEIFCTLELDMVSFSHTFINKIAWMIRKSYTDSSEKSCKRKHNSFKKKHSSTLIII
jgi:hypothetical protein